MNCRNVMRKNASNKHSRCTQLHNSCTRFRSIELSAHFLNFTTTKVWKSLYHCNSIACQCSLKTTRKVLYHLTLLLTCRSFQIFFLFFALFFPALKFTLKLFFLWSFSLAHSTLSITHKISNQEIFIYFLHFICSVVELWIEFYWITLLMYLIMKFLSSSCSINSRNHFEVVKKFNFHENFQKILWMSRRSVDDWSDFRYLELTPLQTMWILYFSQQMLLFFFLLSSPSYVSCWEMLRFFFSSVSLNFFPARERFFCYFSYFFVFVLFPSALMIEEITEISI